MGRESADQHGLLSVILPQQQLPVGAPKGRVLVQKARGRSRSSGGRPQPGFRRQLARRAPGRGLLLCRRAPRVRRIARLRGVPAWARARDIVSS